MSKSTKCRIVSAYLPDKVVDLIDQRVIDGMQGRKVGDGVKLNRSSVMLEIIYKGLGITPADLFAEEVAEANGTKKVSAIPYGTKTKSGHTIRY